MSRLHAELILACVLLMASWPPGPACAGDRIDILDRGAVAGDGIDDSAALAAALAAAGDGGVVTVPAGEFTLGRKVTIPSGVTLRGAGMRRSTMTIVGIAKAGGRNTGDFDALELADGTHDASVEDLGFQGENRPFVAYHGNWSAAIGIRGTKCRDVNICRCRFASLIGFSVHNEGSSQFVDVTGCAFEDCANGLNVNGDYSTQARNHIVNCEGIEASGAHSTYADNVLERCHGTSAISLGGGTTPGATRPGSIVRGNRLIDCAGIGIILSDCACDSLVEGNAVIRPGGTGIYIYSGGYNPTPRNLVLGNVVVDANYIALCVGPGADAATLSGNQCRGGPRQKYGLLCYADDCAVLGNVLSGSFKDASFSGAERTTFAGNACTPERTEAIRGSSFTPASAGAPVPQP